MDLRIATLPNKDAAPRGAEEEKIKGTTAELTQLYHKRPQKPSQKASGGRGNNRC